MTVLRALALAVLMAAGCAAGDQNEPCSSAADCLRTESCIEGFCQPKDAGATLDAGTAIDTGAAIDAGAPPDAATGADTGPVTVPDAGTDAGPSEIDAGPSCTDGLQNGDETHIDCGGGTCPPCADCAACAADSDCERGRCADGQCLLRLEIYVDWLAHCSMDGSAGLDVPGVPAGDYRITALTSAQTVWNPPYSPPTTGWFWRFPCAGISVPMVSTPSGTVYADEAAAFAALASTTQIAPFAGGTLRCEVRDSNCEDNHGGARFALERACP